MLGVLVLKDDSIVLAPEAGLTRGGVGVRFNSMDRINKKGKKKIEVKKDYKNRCLQHFLIQQS